MATALYLVQANPAVGREQEFNDWYEDTHLPEILQIPGFVRARRFQVTEATADKVNLEFLTIYELEGDEDTALGALKEAFASKTLSVTDSISASNGFVVKPISDWVVGKSS